MTEEGTNVSSKAGLVKGLGIGGLVLGIFALIISFVPCLGAYAMFPGIIAVIISAVGLFLASKEKLGKGLLIAALSISILGCIIAGWQYSNILKAQKGLEEMNVNFEEVGNELEKALEDAENQQ